MIIIGHDLVPFEPFFWVKSLSSAKNAPSNSNLIFKFNDASCRELFAFCVENSISFAVEICSLKEAVLANAAGASYLVLNDKNSAKNVQDLAEHYLFDAKILIRSNSETEIENIAKLGIDGVLLKTGEIYGDI